VDLFGLTLQFRGKPEGGYHARGVFRSRGLTATLSSLVPFAAPEIEDLLAQIERQYADFDHPVAWRTRDGRLELGWALDRLGHAAGRITLRDASGDWVLRAPLVGDQSYLPRMALGLRLVLRS
jgi:hypothetical protein